MDFSFLISISDGDVEFISDFVSTYEATTLAQIVKMKQALTDGDFESIGRLAHQIKPTGEMLAFDSQSLIVEMNDNPKTATSERIETVIAEAQQALKAMKAEFSL